MLHTHYETLSSVMGNIVIETRLCINKFERIFLRNKSNGSLKELSLTLKFKKIFYQQPTYQICILRKTQMKY